MNIDRSIKMLLVVFLFAALTACDMSSLPFAKPTATPTPLPTSTATAIPPTSTSTSTSTNTPLPTATKRPTATPNLAATQQYTDMETLVKGLADKGYIAPTEGKFQALDDFTNEWAQLGWYQWEPTGAEPTDFVLQADLSWESASNTPNPSGCGFVFRLQPNNDHYLVFVSTTGHVVYYAAVGADMNFLAANYFGIGGSKGKANFVLIVSGARFRALIDGKSVGAVTGYSGSLLEGELAYTILSGTNVGYGTRCNMTNVTLWQIKP